MLMAVQQGERLRAVAIRKWGVRAPLVVGDNAAWAAALLAACDQALLREVGHIGSKNGMDTSDESVCTHHIDTLLAGFNEGLEQRAHAMVEEAVSSQGARRLCEAFQLRYG